MLTHARRHARGQSLRGSLVSGRARDPDERLAAAGTEHVPPPGASLGYIPFGFFAFLAGPAILPTASTLLPRSRPTRLARASDRPRAAAAAILSATASDATTDTNRREFHTAVRRAVLLVTALRRFY